MYNSLNSGSVVLWADSLSFFSMNDPIVINSARVINLLHSYVLSWSLGRYSRDFAMQCNILLNEFKSS